ncbi:MAG: DUF4157 domain-containing protein [Phormidesmis sp. CAN_BIN44]|nr:DUF4157 domain-containing protein [Phormidesmis sp. CAN_BIN44]
MRTLATKQPAKDAVKQKQHGDSMRLPQVGNSVRSQSISLLSTGQPILQRQCACGGGCPRCQESLLQTKLHISEPGDAYEQEADRVADQVMRMPEPIIQRQEDLEKEGKENVIRSKGVSYPEMPTRSQSSEPVPSIHEALRFSGSPLDSQAREFMESRFGYDFSQVRVYTDERASSSARALGAQAYTLGKNVVFGAGRYQPETQEGKKLLAHELAHTIQQSNASISSSAFTTNAVSQQPSLSHFSTSQIARQDDMDAGVPEIHDAGESLPGGIAEPPTPVSPEPEAAPERTCGPDITSAISTVLSRVDSHFHGLGSWFRKRRSCMVLDIDSIFSGVNPIMAWDTRELFLPNTSFLDPYFRANGCGSPRNPGCDADPTRHLCETAGTCGNTVVVGGKCMLAGTANYAIYGRMFKLCHDEFSPDYPRWDMRAMITLYKTIDGDDPDPPKEMASSAFDGFFPVVPAAVENRGSCTRRCGRTHGGSFDFIWEPYKSR